MVMVTAVKTHNHKLTVRGVKERLFSLFVILVKIFLSLIFHFQRDSDL